MLDFLKSSKNKSVDRALNFICSVLSDEILNKIKSSSCRVLDSEGILFCPVNALRNLQVVFSQEEVEPPLYDHSDTDDETYKIAAFPVKNRKEIIFLIERYLKSKIVVPVEVSASINEDIASVKKQEVADRIAVNRCLEYFNDINFTFECISRSDSRCSFYSSGCSLYT